MPNIRQILNYLASLQETGTVAFNNTKVVTVQFKKPFRKIPMLTFTPNDNLVFPAFKQNVTTTGFKIMLTSNWTGTIDYAANERP